jgi:hypothetical protein
MRMQPGNLLLLENRANLQPDRSRQIRADRIRLLGKRQRRQLMLIRHNVARAEAAVPRAVAVAVAVAANLVVSRAELAKRIPAPSLGLCDGQSLRKAGGTVPGGATRKERFGIL